MNNIAILYIATGRYIVFWDEFFKSVEKFFLPHSIKNYFVFTDSKEQLIGEETGRITKIEQQKLGWPYDTLMRFQMFSRVEKELEENDYIFFFNANYECCRPILEEEILGSEKGLFGFKQVYLYNKPNKKFPYDRNPKSLAYIKEGEGKYYFTGALNGGKSADFLRLIHTLTHHTQKDLEQGIIARVHDESHINRYFLDHEDNVAVFSELYGAPEGSKKIKNPKIISRDKSHWQYGGHNYLRGLTDEKISQYDWEVNKKPKYKLIKIWRKIKKLFK